MDSSSKKHLYENTTLMQKVADNNTEAFNVLYHKYASTLSAYFRQRIHCRTVIEDLTQEVFKRLWRKRHKYRPPTPDLAYLKGFARIVLQEYQTSLKSQLKLRLSFESSLIINSSQIPPPQKAETIERASVIRNLITNLPRKQRQAIELVYYAGQTLTEAAEVMNCSYESIRVHLCLARQKLAKSLSE